MVQGVIFDINLKRGACTIKLRQIQHSHVKREFSGFAQEEFLTSHRSQTCESTEGIRGVMIYFALEMITYSSQ